LLIHISAARYVTVKPIHIAGPKNWRGVSPVRRLVAKNTAMIGRVVATPNATPAMRMAHSRWSSTRRFRMCHHARTRKNRKRQPKRIVAVASTAPPVGSALKHSAETPTSAPTIIRVRPIHLWNRGNPRRMVETNCSGRRSKNSKLGTICNSVMPALAAKCSSRFANGEGPSTGIDASATVRRIAAAIPIAQSSRNRIQRRCLLQDLSFELEECCGFMLHHI